MKIVLAILILTTGSMVAQPSYYSLVKGNDLKAWCKAWDRVVVDEGSARSATQSDTYDAGSCAAYVAGIVDSLPADDDFAPREHVRLSQYIAVIENFLTAHPEIIDKPAMPLVRRALREAFAKNNSK